MSKYSDIDQEALMVYDPIESFLKHSPMGISGRKVRVWSDEEYLYGVFDLGFDEQVVVPFHKTMGPLLETLDSVSFICDSKEEPLKVASARIVKAIAAYSYEKSISSFVAGSGRLYPKDNDSHYWHLSEHCRTRLEESLESAWRLQPLEMEFLYKRKKAGFFFRFAGKSFFLPMGQTLTFYRYGIWQSGFNNVYKELAPHMASAVSICHEERHLYKGLVPFLKKARGLFLLLNAMLHVAFVYVWSFQQRGRGRWVPLFKNRHLRLSLRVLYGYYLHGLLPVVGRWNRILSIGSRKKISPKAVDSLLKKVLKEISEWQRALLDQCEALLLVGVEKESLGVLRRLEKSLELVIVLEETPGTALSTAGVPTFKFHGVGDRSRGHVNTITRRPLLANNLRLWPAVGLLKGVAPLRRETVLAEAFLNYDNRLDGKKVFMHDSYFYGRFTEEALVGGIKGLGVVRLTGRDWFRVERLLRKRHRNRLRAARLAMAKARKHSLRLQGAVKGTVKKVVSTGFVVKKVKKRTSVVSFLQRRKNLHRGATYFKRLRMSPPVVRLGKKLRGISNFKGLAVSQLLYRRRRGAVLKGSSKYLVQYPLRRPVKRAVTTVIGGSLKRGLWKGYRKGVFKGFTRNSSYKRSYKGAFYGKFSRKANGGARGRYQGFNQNYNRGGKYRGAKSGGSVKGFLRGTVKHYKRPYSKQGERRGL